jgi:serine/threonine protein kinase
VTDGSFAHGLVGVTLDGRYRLDAVLGEGGMGSVFRATQLAMDRKVAVKLLKPHLTGDQAALQRFAREARATFRVDSPHAVKILDFGVTPVGDYYMVLEYLDGRTVHRELEIDGPFAPARVAHVARQALHALAAAHARGLIHRDVKPDNLLLMRVGSDPDYTKILDFGVAKLMQGAASDRSQLALTAAGMVFGTPEFMSPEQACGQELDARSDLYSLAATMFVMLTGSPLFEGKTAIELLTHQARTPAPHLAMARPELAAYPELDDLLQRCLAKHRQQRPGSAAEMAALLEQLGPTLTRKAAAAPPPVAVGQAPTPPAAYHASSYFHALHDAEAAEAGSPSAILPSMPSMPSMAGLPRAVKRSRRGLRRWLAGAVVATILGAVIGVAIRTSRSASITGRDPPAGTSHAGGPPPAASGTAPSGTAPSGTAPSGTAASGTAPSGAAASGTAASGTAPSGTAASGTAPSGTAASGTAPSGTAASAPSAPSGTVPPGTSARAPLSSGEVVPPGAAPASAPRDARGQASGAALSRAKAAAAEHLRNAESALRANHHLKQVIEADLALQADPRSVRAKYLLADALIKSGDLDRGCRYLRALKGNRLALRRAQAAGCPSD